MKQYLVILLVLVLQTNLVFSRDYIFNIKEKGAEYKNIVSIKEEKDGYSLKSIVTKEEDKDVVMEARLNKIFETIEWKLTDPKKNLEVLAVREGNKIILTGKFGGRENNRKEIYIDERPWHQIFQMGLMKFAVTETKEKSIEFWGLRPDNPESSGVLAAAKDKTEIIEVNGKKVEASKLRIGLAGWLSIFWTGDYWFRLSDGLYISAKPTGGVFAELTEEKE